MPTLPFLVVVGPIDQHPFGEQPLSSPLLSAQLSFVDLVSEEPRTAGP